MRPAIAEIATLLHSVEATTAPANLETVSLGSLTERQRDILDALSDGLSNKEIAVRYDLSTRTVDMHVRHIFERLNCRTRTEAVKFMLSTIQKP